MSVIGKITGIGFLAGLIVGGTSAASAVLLLYPPLGPETASTYLFQHIPTICWLMAIAALLASQVRIVKNTRKARKSAAHATAIAECDALTSLGNRRALANLVTLAQQRVVSKTCALLMIDLDRFKSVNDQLGHAAGDTVLIHVSAQIRAVCGAKAQAFRLGGDEFAVFVDDVQDSGMLPMLTQALSAAIARPVRHHGWSVAVACSIGHAIGPASVGLEQFLMTADGNMYAQKTIHHVQQAHAAISTVLMPHDFSLPLGQHINQPLETLQPA